MRGAAVLLLGVLAGVSVSGEQAVRAGDHTRQVRVGGGTRTYVLHVPPRPASGPRPLVLVFHGGGSNPQATVRLTGFNALADREGFLVAYPAGSGRLASVLTWNAGACCGYAASQRVDDVAFVRALIDDLVAAAGADRSRVFATGISNGGQMAYRLAAEMPDRIAGIAPVAGSLEVPPSTIRAPVPLLIFHGTHDENLPLEGGAGPRSIAGVKFTPLATALEAFTAVNGCSASATIDHLPDREADTTTVERRTYRCTRAPVVFYLITGGGHTWPGRVVRERLLGTTTRDISATDLMWAFFDSVGR